MKRISRNMLALGQPIAGVLALALSVVACQPGTENQVEAQQSARQEWGAASLAANAATENQNEAQQPGQDAEGTSMNINIIVDGTPVQAVLLNNPTSRDFVAMLPMTVQFEDFGGSEKISHLRPRRLSTEGRTANYAANQWDITYYVPWGNIAIFYKDYDPSGDLIKMGRIVSGQQALMRSGSFSARIERAP
ncbi:MAG: cyclophilin-like fold protein [Pseudomonadota bacterium]|nr:cyclophilin-like fold protein [Pseudomonadota bacterium]